MFDYNLKCYIKTSRYYSLQGRAIQSLEDIAIEIYLYSRGFA